MTDITGQVNELLKARQALPIARHRYSTEQLDDFVKEAYRLHARIADLTGYLRANRSAYLSTSTASRPGRKDAAKSTNPHSQRPFTDRERAELDAHSKAMIRQLNDGITGLAEAEKVRQDTVELLASRKRNKAGLGALGRWAAGGAAAMKTDEEVRQEAKGKSINAHREGVIWLLQKKLEEAGKIQALMMETRLQREEEKAKSVLYKARGVGVSNEKIDTNLLPKKHKRTSTLPDTTTFPDETTTELTEEQVQLFAEENQGMLKHLGQQLDQVRAVHRSLEEISQLQTSLMGNLESQNAHIDQLVQDSFFTEENVGRGNKELKRASERTSTARLLFHGTCAFCTFLVVWDLIF